MSLKETRFIIPFDEKRYIVWFSPDKIDYEALKEESLGRTEWWLYPSVSDPFPKLDRPNGLPAVVDRNRCEWWTNGKHTRTLWMCKDGSFLQTDPACEAPHEPSHALVP
jgi:hypothetical protein